MLAVMRGSIQSFPGVAAPVGGHERAAPLFCITGTAALFRASGPGGISLSRAITYPEAWLPCLWQSIPGRCGPGWLSAETVRSGQPTQRVPRLHPHAAAAAARGGGTLTAKSEAVYKSCWRSAAPGGAALTPAAVAGRTVAQGCRRPSDGPGSGPLRMVGPETKGPTMPPEPPPDSCRRQQQRKQSLFRDRYTGGAAADQPHIVAPKWPDAAMQRWHTGARPDPGAAGRGLTAAESP